MQEGASIYKNITSAVRSRISPNVIFASSKMRMTLRSPVLQVLYDLMKDVCQVSLTGGKKICQLWKSAGLHIIYSGVARSLTKSRNDVICVHWHCGIARAIAWYRTSKEEEDQAAGTS